MDGVPWTISQLIPPPLTCICQVFDKKKLVQIADITSLQPHQKVYRLIILLLFYYIRLSYYIRLYKASLMQVYNIL